MTRSVIIGGGHNGLVAAFYLAKARLRPLVLERREQVGGAASTNEILPGFLVPTLAHACGPLRADVVADLGLARRGLELIEPRVSSFSPREDGRALVLSRDAADTAGHVARFSPRDAERFPAFHRAVVQGASLLADLAREVPPDIDRPEASELWHLLKIGRRFRGLGRPDAYRLLRMAPMAVADLTHDWFETDVLRAAIATRGVLGTNLGPRSAGTVATLLLDAARNPAAPGAPCFVRGGMGRLTEALTVAATDAGAEIRTGVDVARIEVDDAGVGGVLLATGERIATDLVVSNADPKRTLLGLVDPLRLDPGFLQRVRNIRARGTLAKVNLALAALPSFTAERDLPGHLPATEALAGRILIAPGIDYLERAFDRSKYGQPPERPFLECVIPSLTDAALAPPGRHVMSIYVQYAPYDLRGRSWDATRDAVQQTVLETLAEHAPGLPSLVLAAQTITPADLEGTYGFSGGHIHHGEMALDQLYVMRPLLGWAQHRTPIAGLYLCGAGTHPGGGITGANGANAARVVIRDRVGRPGGRQG
jgi:phytoene dehydrogenase-like protein